MQEHPVPQNVTGYEFHLIGQMTLKQFMEIAGGILVAVIINATNLPGFVKYPLMAIAGLTGAALAFIPLEGRPLDRWFFAFIKSIYQPTMFFWKKTVKTPKAFEYTIPTNTDTSPQVDYAPIRHSRVQEFLRTLPSDTKAASDEDDQKAEAVLSLFSETSVIAAPKPAQTLLQPAESLVVKHDVSSPTGRIVEMVFDSDRDTQAVTKVKEDVLVEADVKATPITTVGYTKHAGVTPIAITPSGKQNSPIAGEFTIVQPTAPSTAPQESAKPVQTLSTLPFPSKPTAANMIVGMVVSSDQKILENAIVTIVRASDKTPVRALKTNALGQFGVVTPLESGSYLIEIEKDGHRFDNQSLVLNNQVVEPILITASSS